MSESWDGADNLVWEQKRGCWNCQLPEKFLPVDKATSRSPPPRPRPRKAPDDTPAEGHAVSVGSFALSSWCPFHCWTAWVLSEPKSDSRKFCLGSRSLKTPLMFFPSVLFSGLNTSAVQQDQMLGDGFSWEKTGFSDEPFLDKVRHFPRSLLIYKQEGGSPGKRKLGDLRRG